MQVLSDEINFSFFLLICFLYRVCVTQWLNIINDLPPSFTNAIIVFRKLVWLFFAVSQFLQYHLNYWIFDTWRYEFQVNIDLRCLVSTLQQTHSVSKVLRASNLTRTMRLLLKMLFWLSYFFSVLSVTSILSNIITVWRISKVSTFL